MLKLVHRRRYISSGVSNTHDYLSMFYLHASSASGDFCLESIRTSRKLSTIGSFEKPKNTPQVSINDAPMMLYLELAIPCIQN